MAAESGGTAIDPGLDSGSTDDGPRRRPVRLGAAVALLLAVAAGGLAVVERASEPGGASLPAVVLGESVSPLVVYELRETGALSAAPVASLHVRFAMLRHGPAPGDWALTLVAPDEARSGIGALMDNGRHLVVVFDGNEYGVGVSNPADFDGEAVDFLTLLPSRDIALDLAHSVTTSVTEGPPIGHLAT